MKVILPKIPLVLVSFGHKSWHSPLMY